jgi:hypothetical protein
MPCSPLKAELCLPPAFTLVPCSAYSSTLKMEAICASETSIVFQRTTRRYNPEESTLHDFVCLLEHNKANPPSAQLCAGVCNTTAYRCWLY